MQTEWVWAVQQEKHLRRSDYEGLDYASSCTANRCQYVFVYLDCYIIREVIVRVEITIDRSQWGLIPKIQRLKKYEITQIRWWRFFIHIDWNIYHVRREQ